MNNQTYIESSYLGNASFLEHLINLAKETYRFGSSAQLKIPIRNCGELKLDENTMPNEQQFFGYFVVHFNSNASPTNEEILNVKLKNHRYFILSYPDVDVKIIHPFPFTSLTNRPYIRGVCDAYSLIKDYALLKKSKFPASVLSEDMSNDVYNAYETLLPLFLSKQLISSKEPVDGDLVIFTNAKGKIFPSHLGVFLKNNLILHQPVMKYSAITHMVDCVDRELILGYARINNV